MAASWGGYGPAPAAPPSASLIPQNVSTERSSKKPQSRQLLSCTKCRERKVKCDRTKPCSACCARGHPKECEFVVGEGNDYSPIQQSYEIRKLRAENQRLRERLQASRLSHSGEEEDDGEPEERKGSVRAAVARQRRFKTSERVDNLYFGTPGLANIVNDFNNLQVGDQSLTHTIPRAQDMYANVQVGSRYPFPIFANWAGENSAVMLLSCLPPRQELYELLELFQHRAQASSFPHTPDEITKKEVDRFLNDPEINAEAHPDMLALIFATLATGLQMGVFDRSGGQWISGAMEEATARADVYLAASMQALRMASFMYQPTLLGIQTLIMIGPYLTNTGRFLDAWTLFGTTIRMAHAIGLHRNPKFLDHTPPLRECMRRQTLWWWMLHMDQQYSVTLGRPLGISGIGDCPPPEPLTTNPTILRLGEFVDHFTILSRQILTSDGLVNLAKIDEFTDKLLGLWDTMPEALQFNESWTRQETHLPEWPLEVMSATLFAKVQCLLILLNRQRFERTQSTAAEGSPPGSRMPPSRSQSIANPNQMQYGISEQLLHPAPLRGRELVINSSALLLKTFLFFYHRNPAVLACWTMGQQAFSACMILILDAWETENEQNEWIVNQAFAVFAELEKKRVHKLAELAVQRISTGLGHLEQRRMDRDRQAAVSSLASDHERQSGMSSLASGHHQPPMLTLDTASMADWTNDSVMGNTGMFLLEDTGLQSMSQQAFLPLGWNMAGSAHPSHDSGPPTPRIPSPTVPVSQVVAAPFPVMSPSFIPSTIPVTNSPFAVGLQPRMPTLHHHHHHAPASWHTQHQQPSHQQHSHPHGLQSQQAAFTPINPSHTIAPSSQHSSHGSTVRQIQPQAIHSSQQQQQQQRSFSQMRGPRHAVSHNNVNSVGTGGGPQRVHKLDRPPGASGGRATHRRK